MLLDLLLENQLAVLSVQRIQAVLTHIEVVLFLLQAHHFRRVYLPLLVQSLQYAIHASFGHNEQLIEDFRFVEEELQFGHHFVKQFQGGIAFYHQSVEVEDVEVGLYRQFKRVIN